jgi:hypothetical protein
MDEVVNVGVVSADKMMIKARGPVWHKKQKQQGLVPKGLHGLDRDATWSFSKADGWVYGHGTFCIALHEPSILGAFKWMPNSAHEAKRLQAELPKFERQIKIVCMDSKADDYPLYRDLKAKYDIQLLTTMRRGKDKTPERQQMRQALNTLRHRHIYTQRSHTVEPMQSLVKTIFDLDQCWMRGNDTQRWLFAAMGVAVQIAQFQAFRAQRSTWRIKDAVLGV